MDLGPFTTASNRVHDHCSLIEHVKELASRNLEGHHVHVVREKCFQQMVNIAMI